MGELIEWRVLMGDQGISVEDLGYWLSGLRSSSKSESPDWMSEFFLLGLGESI